MLLTYSILVGCSVLSGILTPIAIRRLGKTLRSDVKTNGLLWGFVGAIVWPVWLPWSLICFLVCYSIDREDRLKGEETTTPGFSRSNRQKDRDGSS